MSIISFFASRVVGRADGGCDVAGEGRAGRRRGSFVLRGEGKGACPG